MAGVTADINLSIIGRLTGTADLGTPAAPVRVEKHIQITAGTDATSKANILFADTRALGISATEDLDLAGVLSGLLGGTVTAAEITAIYIEADEDNTADMTFFGAASNAFNGSLGGTTPTLTLGPGDCALMSRKAGMTVTAGTGDLLTVTNGAAAGNYTIVLIGRTVAA